MVKNLLLTLFLSWAITYPLHADEMAENNTSCHKVVCPVEDNETDTNSNLFEDVAYLLEHNETNNISCSDKVLQIIWENQLTFYTQPNFGPKISDSIDEDNKQWFEKRALQGDAQAQFILGYIYYMGVTIEHGENAKPNYTKAKEWFTKSAQQGSLRGQFGLAGLYYFGKGVNKNYVQAITRFETPVLQDVQAVQLILATIYSAGQNGIPRDLTRTKSLLEKLALQGEATAQLKLADMYLTGEGTERDPRKAKEWYEKAAEQHLVEAQLALWQLYLSGKDIPKDEVKAQEWFNKALDQDVGMAQLAQGKHYYLGTDAQQDLTKAKEWLEKAANHGSIEAQYLLGKIYSEDAGIKQDFNKAQKWFIQAAKSNSGLAEYYKQLMQKELGNKPKEFSLQAYYKLQTTCTLNTLIVPKLLELRQRLSAPKTTPK